MRIQLQLTGQGGFSNFTDYVGLVRIGYGYIDYFLIRITDLVGFSNLGILGVPTI